MCVCVGCLADERNVVMIINAFNISNGIILKGHFDTIPFRYPDR